MLETLLYRGAARWFVALTLLLAVLPGCSRLRLGRLNQPVPQFQSPLQARNYQIAEGKQIADIVRERESSLRTVKATMNLVLGGTGSGRQGFAATTFAQFPGKVRVRGSQQEMGTVFDALVDDRRFTAVLFPERSYFEGTVDEARRNPRVLAGIDPSILLQVLRIDSVFLDRASRYGQVPLVRGRGSYVIRYNYSDGTAEQFQFRPADLLIERYEIYNGNQLATGVTFTGYMVAAQNVLVPTGFIVDVPAAGGQFAASVGDVTVNEPPPSAAFSITIPEGFQRI